MTVALLAVVLAVVQEGSPSRSVYHFSPQVDVPITLVGAAGIALPYLFEHQLIRRRCPCDPRTVNAFDRGAIGNRSDFARHLSDATVAAAVVVPLVLDAKAVGAGRVWNEDAAVLFETLAVNGALVTAVKYIVQRPLPRTYAGDSALIVEPEGYRAFYSGHTSTAFAGLAAAAMTLRYRYGAKAWPWIVTGVVGTSVAIERVADGRHFPSDVIVGAVMGTAVGIVVPALHARHGGRARLSTQPLRDGRVAVGINWTF
jgi:membrane-associated phospholipid phosphatase